jgi:hypothetical protein
MRGTPSQTVAVVPTTGMPPLHALVLNAPGGASVTVEFCDDNWRPLAAGATYALGTGATATLGGLAGVSNVPAGATRIKAYTDRILFYNLSGNADWSYTFTPTVNQIPAGTEFDFPEVS